MVWTARPLSSANAGAKRQWQKRQPIRHSGRMRPPFVPGIELARLYHRELVGPLLDRYFPGLAYSAALVGPGSEVLGFDTPRSTDHDWGPRLQVFLADQGPADEIREV